MACAYLRQRAVSAADGLGAGQGEAGKPGCRQLLGDDILQQAEWTVCKPPQICCQVHIAHCKQASVHTCGLLGSWDGMGMDVSTTSSSCLVGTAAQPFPSKHNGSELCWK